MEVKIQGKTVTTERNYLDPVTYVPNHAKGNANHPDAQLGVILAVTEHGIRVLYCKSRTSQLTNPENLVFG